MALNRARARARLQDFAFARLFIEELGWNSLPPESAKPIDDTGYLHRAIAEMSGVFVFEVFPAAPADALPAAKTCAQLHSKIEKRAYENVLIFLDEDAERSQCLMYWVKRENGKKRPRRHPYFKGQPGDLFMSKIDSMVIDMEDRRPDGSVPLAEVTRRLATALDIERVTKNFYGEFSKLRVNFVDMIAGIPSKVDRDWYASVLLNRLMFIYFLQKRGFIQNNVAYLDDKLKESQKRGPDRYYSEFLPALFFEGFAKPAEKRSEDAGRLLGPIPYLNGGLFIPHQLELQYKGIQIPDRAFENVLDLFSRYSWHLDDTPGAADNEINPAVLGYIFEKYINQKAYGAYYTRSEITEYLCERSIHAVILQRVKQYDSRRYSDLSELLMRLDAPLCRLLLGEILPKLSVLDPACGSGAFLVAALKNLLNIYGAVYGKIEVLNDTNLSQQLADIRDKHPSLNYYIRKQIIVDSLYGVDIMDEATEIAKLRLFLALVGVADTSEELEPLPNIDFNIMSGNSLIGLLTVDEKRFAGRQQDMMQHLKAQDYRRALTEKNRLVQLYRETSSWTDNLQGLRDKIEAHKDDAYAVLNGILLDDFQALKIQYQAAQLKGKAKKRPLKLADIEALKPFHWGYEFDEILETRGGFDVIITNPPWEGFKPKDKEFFPDYDSHITANKMRITTFKQLKAQLLQDPVIQRAYLKYKSGFPYVSAFYRNAPQYKNQISRVNGKKQGSDIDFYKLFTEQCFNLLRVGGICGIVIPSGIYTDLGTKQLRTMLFEETKLSGLFCFENRKSIFEGVHKSFKFVVLAFEKGGNTESFPAAFMRHDVRELADFPNENSLKISVDLLKNLSPISLSVTEFKNRMDLHINEKNQNFFWPAVVRQVHFSRELDLTNDSGLFHDTELINHLALYEGKMIYQFFYGYAALRYWIDEKAGRRRILGKKVDDSGQTLDYQMYRFAFRSVAASTNERTLISTIIPPNYFAANSLQTVHILADGVRLISNASQIFLAAVFNSFALDYLLWQRVTTNFNLFFIYQLPVPPPDPSAPNFERIVRRAARLICTAPEYDALAAEVGLGSHRAGATEPAERARLRAELDGIIAHIYGLTEAEFEYVLSTFPLVEGRVKAAALAAYQAEAGRATASNR